MRIIATSMEDITIDEDESNLDGEYSYNEDDSRLDRE
jgi:hypothetical protein